MDEAPAISLPQLFDRFVGCTSSRQLLERLEQTVEDIGAGTGRLYLLDSETMSFYPVAAFGCQDTDQELPFDEVLVDPQPGQHLLYQGGDPVGLLLVGGDTAELGSTLAALLGPAIVGVQQAENTLAELRKTHEQVSHLVTAGRLLRHLDIDVLLVEIIQTVLSSVEAQVAAVLTQDRDVGQLVIRTTWGLRDEHIDGIRLCAGERVCDAVFRSGEILRVAGQDEIAERLDLSGVEAHITGILCLPLVVSDRRLGVLLLANPEQEFSGDSERLGQMVCDMAAIALDNAQLVQSRVERERLGREMDLAKEVQAKMSPDGPLTVGRVQVAGANRAADETGGDYFTYLQRGQRLAALIGDVTGHGLGAALFTTAAHAIIQQQLASDQPIVDAMRVLNEGLYLTHSGRFMTAALLEIDPDSLQLEYFSCGHNPLLLIRDGQRSWLDSHGVPLGIMRGLLDDQPTRLQLSPGDTLVLYTDGFTEAFNRAGECSGEERFADWVGEGLDESLLPEELVDHVYARTAGWMEGTPPTDDLTLVVIQV